MCCFFNDTATTEIYTLSLHDALPIWNWDGKYTGKGRLWALLSGERGQYELAQHLVYLDKINYRLPNDRQEGRSEEHTSELQLRQYLVCRLLLEKKKSFYSRLSWHFLL